MNKSLATRLREAMGNVRTKSYPLADLIPLIQEAADALEAKPSGAVPLPDASDAEPAPPNNLPDWEECALRVANSDFIAKRVAEGGYGAEHDTKLATELHRFVHEYDDADPIRSGWFMHRLERLLIEERAAAVSQVGEPVKLGVDWCAQWLRNNYQDHPNIVELCAAMREAAAAAPVADDVARDAGWVELTPSVRDEMEGLHWLATKSNAVISGTYEWVQGWNPHTFETASHGRISADIVTHVMPVTKPLAPRAAIKPKGTP